MGRELCLCELESVGQTKKVKTKKKALHEEIRLILDVQLYYSKMIESLSESSTDNKQITTQKLHQTEYKLNSNLTYYSASLETDTAKSELKQLLAITVT